MTCGTWYQQEPWSEVLGGEMLLRTLYIFLPQKALPNTYFFHLPQYTHVSDPRISSHFSVATV